MTYYKEIIEEIQVWDNNSIFSRLEAYGRMRINPDFIYRANAIRMIQLGIVDEVTDINELEESGFFKNIIFENEKSKKKYIDESIFIKNNHTTLLLIAMRKKYNTLLSEKQSEKEKALKELKEKVTKNFYEMCFSNDRYTPILEDKNYYITK